MCAALDISRSSYHEWQKRPLSLRKIENKDIAGIMTESHRINEGMCGLDKLWEDVKESYPHCSRNRAYKIQKELKLYSVRKKQFRRINTTDSNHKLPIAENLLNQRFNVHEPNKVWSSDITYLNTNTGTAYLAIVKDLYDKEIVGWALADNMRTELCLKALKNAIHKRRPGKELIHHSDRGSQFCSNEYQKVLKQNNILCSMSGKGNCYDNAPAESFFGSLKSERTRWRRYKDIDELRQDIFWYIECFYNRNRRHAALSNKTILAFKNLYLGKQNQKAA